MRLRLLVPDLWPPAGMEDAGSGLRLPGLEWLLGKGTIADSAGESFEGWLCRSFGVERRGDWPVAALTLLADCGDPATDVWLRADPVSLRADGARLVLADSAALRLSPGEAASLTQTLSRHF
ncbi:MAG TPA: regulator, partial [Burkholderiales bacterium]